MTKKKEEAPETVEVQVIETTVTTYRVPEAVVTGPWDRLDDDSRALLLQDRWLVDAQVTERDVSAS